MKTFKSSLSEFNSMHPLLAALTIGLFAVGMIALTMPGGVERADAWTLFVAIGAGGGLGRWVHARSQQARRSRSSQ